VVNRDEDFVANDLGVIVVGSHNPRFVRKTPMGVGVIGQFLKPMSGFGEGSANLADHKSVDILSFLLSDSFLSSLAYLEINPFEADLVGMPKQSPWLATLSVANRKASSAKVVINGDFIAVGVGFHFITKGKAFSKILIVVRCASQS